MSETISKASVCEILADIYPTDGEKVVAVKEIDKAYEAIQQLPSSQPEIIRCKDCMCWDKSWANDWGKDYHYCIMVDSVRKGDFYCADAERRTDETD